MLGWLRKRRTVKLTRVDGGDWVEQAPTVMCRTCRVRRCDFMGYCWEHAPEQVDVYVGPRHLAPGRQPLVEIPRNA